MVLYKNVHNEKRASHGVGHVRLSLQLAMAPESRVERCFAVVHVVGVSTGNGCRSVSPNLPGESGLI